MNRNQPPKLATWMLQHFGSGADNETLLGDLAEQYQQKRSALWYWRQALKAIPVSLFKEIRGHKRIAAQGLVTGWVMWIIGGALIFPLVFLGTNIGYDFEPSHIIGSAWSFMWMPVLGPVSFHRSGALAFAIALPLMVGVMCGWLVARWQVSARKRPLSVQVSRVHRNQKTGAVLLFAASILLIDILLLGPFVSGVGSAMVQSVAGPLTANVAASVLGIVLGGGLLRSHPQTVQQ